MGTCHSDLITMEKIILYSPPGRTQKHEFCAGEYTTEVGLPCCIVRPPSSKEVGKISFMTELMTLSHWKKNKAKTMEQMFMILPLQCNFHCYKVILHPKHFGRL